MSYEAQDLLWVLSKAGLVSSLNGVKTAPEVMESPQAQLCDFCSRWFSHRKLFPLSIDDIRYQQTLRRLEEIRDETQCPLCTLILSSLSTDPQVLELTCEVPTYVHFEPYIYGTIGAEAFGAEKTTIARIWFALIVGRNDWSHDRDGTIYGHGVQVSGERVESKDKQLLLGRKIGSTCVDQALLLSWLSLCTNQHGHDCTPAPFGFDPGFALRLIDVKRRCVVDPPPHPRYVALSYVWGNSVQVTLEEKHYLRLRKEGGLSDDYADIGTTIKDAMYLCEQLGEHYLWVDGLCIKQDDEEDRARQICSMNQIYSCAAFTIVAAGGDNAYAPLPGVRENSRSVIQHEAEIQGLHLMTTQRPFLASVSKSKWSSRGWTFQEKILSKRLLIFTPYQTFFQCGQAIFYEDTVLERSSHSPDVDISQEERMDLRRHLSKPTADMCPLRKYGTCIQGYACRDLTKQYDGLNAFQGVLNILRPEFSDGFHWGLPESMFDIAITWLFGNHYPERRRQGFPSWSWLGWREGPNNSLSSHTGDTRSIIREIQWYKINKDGEAIHIKAQDTANEEATSHDASVSAFKWKPDHVPPVSSLHSLDPRGVPFTHFIRFWSSVARLHVDREGVRGESRWGNDRLVIRTSTSGPSVGLIYLHSKWRQARPDNLDFVVLCRYSSYKPGKYNLKSGLVVLLVELEAHSSVAHRVQRVLEPVDEAVWILAKPRWKLITLA
ncbi:hypothetical protein HO173_005748 [Letharia columbiana]|uniref:Heterokaryon incompatibility domain-containing protein n=1 Tax=Letharia columbiana TaxID=112416 RepID=A0A8H6L5D3_9LECA|nr:uncharacterized protein HO173_005748 [Letharia columbiana]KAF6236120.1 hypothetical protein HO173_005748 [Letharia columbiana]